MSFKCFVYTDIPRLIDYYQEKAFPFTEDTMQLGVGYAGVPDRAVICFKSDTLKLALCQTLAELMDGEDVFFIDYDSDFYDMVEKIDKLVNPPSTLVDYDDVKDTDWSKIPHYKTGIAPLDDAIMGLHVGNVSMLFSCAGEGKTTLATAIMNNILVNYPDIQVLSYSGEMDDGIFKHNALIQLASSSWVESGKIDEYKPYIQKALNRRVKMISCDLQLSSAKDVDTVANQIKQSLEFFPKIKLVIVDNLMTAMDETMLQSYDLNTAQGVFMEELTRIARQYQVHVMLVAHTRKLTDRKKEFDHESVSGSNALGNKAYVCISIQRTMEKYKDKEEEVDFARVGVTKNRAGGVWLTGDDRIRLKYIPETHNYQYENKGFKPQEWSNMPIADFIGKVSRMKVEGCLND